VPFVPTCFSSKGPTAVPYRRFVQTQTPIEIETLVLQAAEIIKQAKQLGGQPLLDVLELLLVYERKQQTPDEPENTPHGLRH